jgi:hypothetical protein
MDRTWLLKQECAAFQLSDSRFHAAVTAEKDRPRRPRTLGQAGSHRPVVAPLGDVEQHENAGDNDEIQEQPDDTDRVVGIALIGRRVLRKWR